MSVKSFFTLIALATAVSWAGWFVVLAFIDPESSGLMGFIFFYLSLGLALVGIFALIGFAARFFLHKDVALYKQLRVTVRQAILLSVLILVVLMLQGARFLSWWNAILVVFVFVLLELFFLSFKKFNNRT